MLWKRRADSHLFGPTAQRELGVRTAAGPAMAHTGEPARATVCKNGPTLLYNWVTLLGIIPRDSAFARGSLEHPIFVMG